MARTTTKTASRSTQSSAASTEKASRARSGETLEQCVLRSLAQYFEDLDGARPHALHEMVITAVEFPLLQFAMARAEGNQSAAAELLGINRNTLRKKLQHYRLV
jgi:Fis family transcriptional regulator, factor for inversion stimulation protein